MSEDVRQGRQDTSVFRFMHGKLIGAMQAGREGEAWAWAVMLAHYVRMLARLRMIVREQVKGRGC